MNDERLFKFVLMCCKKKDIPDLHSFVIEIDDGKAFVECEGGTADVYIDGFCYKDGKEKRIQFRGTAVAATSFLEIRNAKIETIEQ